jgi:hypothetical protein
MIRSHLRAGIALACALGLSACGGGDGDVYISGTTVGVTKPGLVLTNNGGSDLEVGTSGVFTFKVETDTRYFIEVKSVPPNVEKKEDCELKNPTGRAVFNVSNIRVICTIRKWPLGGSIVGLDNNSGLVLVNGNDRVAIPAGATTFAMAPVSEESPYGITILDQPSTRTCTVENGTGKMPSGPFTNVVVRCTP